MHECSPGIVWRAGPRSSGKRDYVEFVPMKMGRRQAGEGGQLALGCRRRRVVSGDGLSIEQDQQATEAPGESAFLVLARQGPHL